MKTAGQFPLYDLIYPLLIDILYFIDEQSHYLKEFMIPVFPLRTQSRRLEIDGLFAIFLYKKGGYLENP